VTAGLFFGTLLVLSAGLDAVEPQSREALIRAQIEAGEFASALAAARSAPTVEERDAWLGRIALAQARAGGREASLRSSSEIQSDRARASTLSEIAAEPLGGRGGAAMADFDSLIDLITSTVEPDLWEDVGGPGSIESFATGVFIDPQGVLRLSARQDENGELAALRARSAARSHQEDVHRSSPLRMVSLPRLEKQVHLRLAAGRSATEAMRFMAGLTRIQYVFVYPESGDLVLAGPAGDWQLGEENRVLGTESGRPVLRLDDLVVILRHVALGPGTRFGCLITPTQAGLGRVQAFVKESNKRPLRPGQRSSWLKQLQAELGKQEIDVYGLDPRTRAAAVMVEADYRMKLVGMGLERGVPGVVSYLDLVKASAGPDPSSMDVLRWWFTLDYQAVLLAEDRLAAAIRGQGVQVKSENELLAADGERIHTGKSDALNRRFAQSFTAHFEALAERYPIYAELRNLADLALACALIREHGLAEQAGWHMTCFGDPEVYRPRLGPAPRQVDTVVNHRTIGKGLFVVGVSGGVRIDPAALVAPRAMEIESDGELARRRSGTVPKDLAPDAWWWD
jgi:hypothetical protein